jgi:thiol-disulfide isomerase/thioredoxin
MRQILAGSTALLFGHATLFAADMPPVEQLLKYKPAQLGVVCDTPAAETWPKCKVEYVKGPSGNGYVVRDMNGLTVRKLMASPESKGKINVRSYYLQGQEVYREVDTNANGVSDEFKWFNMGGSRTGVSAEDESQRIVKWKTLSAEEATAEVIAAAVTKDPTRLQAVMLTDADVKELGLDEKSSARVAGGMDKVQAEFKALWDSLPADAKWSRFDGHTPMAISAADVGAAKDVTLYHNATITVESAGKPIWLRAPEIVRLGDVWKLTAIPIVIDDKKPVETVGVLVPALDQKVAAASEGDSPVESSDEVQNLVAQLQKHDETMPKDGDAQKLVKYHSDRYALCAAIGSKSRKQANIEHWYKQAADSLDAAVQTKGFPEGVGYLEKASARFAEKEWGKRLAAYFKYRAINSAYSLKVDGKEDGKAQEAYLAELGKFVKDYPAADDAADALWQLGNGAEFAGKEHDALGHYKDLAEKHDKSNFAKKAVGAIKRLEAVGRPAHFAGDGMNGSPVDTASLRGKVVLVHYWATWCDACVAEVPKLAAAREKFGAKGFEIVGVNIDTDAQKALAKARQLQLDWPQIQDKGGLDGDLASQFGIVILPTMMLLDESGKVLNRNLQASQLEMEIEKALSKKLASKPE